MSSELEIFAATFKSEEELRQHVATLLRKMGRNQGVEVTHGMQEYGKDIIFYSADGLDEWMLNACVVKNGKITGSADDNKGARNVFNQVEQALDTPFINNTGENERVARVYVISPHDCPQTTMRSIQGKLEKRSGQVAFLCGSRLLEKFTEFWPEFLIFESSLLGSYVATLQKAFEQSDPIAFLMSQHQIFSISRKTFSRIYVRQDFCKTLQKVRLIGELPKIFDLENPVTGGALNKIIESLELLVTLLRNSQVPDAGQRPLASKLSLELDALASKLKLEWQRRYDQEKRLASERKEPAPPVDRVRLLLKGLITTDNREAISKANDIIGQFLHSVEQANRFVKHHPDLLAVLHSAGHLTYCRVQEVVQALPTVFEKDLAGTIEIPIPADLLEKVWKPVLITAPAGYGKTSFCKWNALMDVNRLATKAAETIPIYVALHQLANIAVTTIEEVFLKSTEIQKLFDDAAINNRPVRLYLDGLDEVVTSDQQDKLMTLAQQIPSRFPNVQIVVTGRDYVSGPSLRWLARVSLAPLNDNQTSELISNWLEDDAQGFVEFKAQLLNARILEPLMHIPLLGTLTIAVFKKNRSLPENKIRLYEIFVDLMCGGWDIAKNVRRESKFGSNVKLSILTRLAGKLQNRGIREATELDVQVTVQNTLYAFSDRWRSLLDEILEDGLLIRAGAGLAFSHLSFQEFLAARDLTDPSGSRQQVVLTDFLSGQDRWREALAFYVGMSNRPNEMAGWVSSGARYGVASDLTDRINFLLDSIKASSPGWIRPSSG
jgi:hypothetical protein